MQGGVGVSNCLSSLGDLHWSHCHGSLLAYIAFSNSSPPVWWLLLASSPVWKTRLPTWPLLAWGRGAQFFQWYLAGVEQFLPESSLSWALFLILWLERTAFLSSPLSSTSPASTPVGVFAVAVFSKSEKFGAKQKLRDITRVSFLGCWGP